MYIHVHYFSQSYYGMTRQRLEDDGKKFGRRFTDDELEIVYRNVADMRRGVEVLHDLSLQVPVLNHLMSMSMTIVSQ